jgi:quercetin dioxygenase-like cupin family protein
MKVSYTKFIGAAVLICITIIARAASEGKPSVNIPVTQLQYVSTGVTDGVTGEVKVAPAYGDLAHGAHGTFLKMPAGFVTPIHTHTDDYYGVVISGVGVNVTVGGTEVPLPAGSYWFQKGGERHITKCISSNECIFFLSQAAKFDFLPDAVKK